MSEEAREAYRRSLQIRGQPVPKAYLKVTGQTRNQWSFSTLTTSRNSNRLVIRWPGCLSPLSPIGGLIIPFWKGISIHSGSDPSGAFAGRFRHQARPWAHSAVFGIFVLNLKHGISGREATRYVTATREKFHGRRPAARSVGLLPN